MNRLLLTLLILVLFLGCTAQLHPSLPRLPGCFRHGGSCLPAIHPDPNDLSIYRSPFERPDFPGEGTDALLGEVQVLAWDITPSPSNRLPLMQTLD